MKTAKAMHGTEYLLEPLTKDEINEMMGLDRDRGIEACVAIDLDFILEGIEALNDAISEEMIGSCMLQEIGFRPVDAIDTFVVFEVSGWVDDDDLDYDLDYL